MAKCPRCKTKLDLKGAKCQSCGVKIANIYGASNHKAITLLKTRRKDEREHIKKIKEAILPIDTEIKEKKSLLKYAKTDKEKNAILHSLSDLRYKRQKNIAKMNRDNKEAIYYSTVLTKDISKTKLLIIAVLLGTFGAHSFYVGRNWRGLFSLVLWVFFLIMFILFEVVMYPFTVPMLMLTLMVLYQVAGAIAVILMLTDIARIVLGRYSVPVVLKSDKD